MGPCYRQWYIKEPTRGCLNCNTSRILVFARYVEVRGIFVYLSYYKFGFFLTNFGLHPTSALMSPLRCQTSAHIIMSTIFKHALTYIMVEMASISNNTWGTSVHCFPKIGSFLSKCPWSLAYQFLMYRSEWYRMISKLLSNTHILLVSKRCVIILIIENVLSTHVYRNTLHMMHNKIMLQTPSHIYCRSNYPMQSQRGIQRQAWFAFEYTNKLFQILHKETLQFATTIELHISLIDAWQWPRTHTIVLQTPSYVHPRFLNFYFYK